MQKLLLLTLLATSATFAQPRDLAITNAHLPGSTDRITVLIHNGRISAVGAMKAPDGVTVINAGGRTVSPGLFDMHTHMRASAVGGDSADWLKNAQAYLYCGVTSVIELSSQGEMFEPLRRLTPGPHMQIASRMSPPGGHGIEGGRGEVFTLEVLTPRQAVAAVKSVLPYKPDVIKVFTDGWRYGAASDMTSMDEATLKALVEEAHKSNIPVVTHTVTLEKAKIGARAGVDALIHGIGDAPVDEEFVRLMKQSGTVYTPTLSVYRVERTGVDPILEALLEPRALELLKAPARPTPASTARRWKNLTGNVAALYKAGVPIGVGTDAGMPGTYHGWATLKEMQLLASAGMTPADVWKGATELPARVLHVDKDRGSIAEGKLADLVLYDGDPAVDVNDATKIWKVIYNGAEVDRGALSKAILSSGVTKLASTPAPRKIDDFERTDGRTSQGALRVNSTDPGHDHARMLFERTVRGPGNHAMTILAKMTDAAKPYGRLILPLRVGGLEPVDASMWHGVECMVRGEGSYELIFAGHGASYRAQVTGTGTWKRVRVPFSAFPKLTASAEKSLYSLAFEVARQPGEEAWLELDDVTFY